MKNWIWIPLAAMVGLIAGYWGPKEDVRLLKERKQAEKAERKASAAAGFDAFAKLTGIPDVAKRKSAKPADKPTKTEEKPTADQKDAEKPAKAKKEPKVSSRDLRARIDEASELWRTRIELATVQWKAKLGLEEGDGSEAFDTVIAGMNDALRESMEALAEEIESAGKVTPELSLRMMGDASKIMVEAYEELASSVSEENRGKLSELPVFEFIDPSVAEPLLGVEEKLEHGHRGGNP